MRAECRCFRHSRRIVLCAVERNKNAASHGIAFEWRWLKNANGKAPEHRAKLNVTCDISRTTISHSHGMRHYARYVLRRRVNICTVHTYARNAELTKLNWAWRTTKSNIWRIVTRAGRVVCIRPHKDAKPTASALSCRMFGGARPKLGHVVWMNRCYLSYSVSVC